MTVLSQQSKRLRVEPLGVALVVAAFLVWQARMASLGPALALPVGFVGVVVIDAIWSMWVTRPLRVQIVLTGPEIAVEGFPIEMFLSIDTRRRCRGLLARLTLGDDVSVTPAPVSAPAGGWRQLPLPARGQLTATAPRRGVYAACTLVMEHTAPLGLCGIEQTACVALQRPIWVLPRLERLELPELRAAPRSAGEAEPHASSEPELLRGTRPFQAGDALRHVHWPQLARTGQLGVREFDALSVPAVRIVVDLGAVAGEAAERTARWAAFAVQRQLDLGCEVELVTWRTPQADVTFVRTAESAGKCLALAETGGLGDFATQPGDRPTLLIGPDGARPLR